MTVQLLRGDCIEVMRGLDAQSIDAIVTDPPYGIRFMGKSWDGANIEAEVAERRAHKSHDPSGGPNGGHKSIASEAGKYDLRPSANQAFQEWTRLWAVEALRVLKPGGWLLSFASTRTYHRMTCGLEDAGFEIRDQVGWMFGSGFPKSHNGEWGGTALKPAWEPIAMARKPLIGTVEANWREHGTGALNIDACRIPHGEVLRAGAGATWDAMHRYEGREGEASAERTYSEIGGTNFAMKPGPRGGDVSGRWPANLIHDGSDEVLACFPDAPGQQGQLTGDEPSGKMGRANTYGVMDRRHEATPRGDAGSAARFFYCAKASRADRNEGLEGLEGRVTDDGRKVPCDNAYQRGVTQRQNHHPTVKPTDLMRYLVRLVTPAGGVVLDPFTGSGSTGKAAVLEGLRFIGIERDQDEDGASLGYMDIARARIAYAQALAASGAETLQPASARDSHTFDLFSGASHA